MPKSQIGIAAISNRSDLNCRGATEIATKIVYESVERGVDIAIEYAQNFKTLRFQAAGGLNLKSLALWAV